ncbi:hypothetical protein EV360DRAFT_85757 [Lentinula raphanica]|nr:hypothetical protein EV360DRAFT_85757 [Lentinula raphanica]
MAQIFNKLVIYLPSSLSAIRSRQLTDLIETHGGTVARSADDTTITHVVTNSHRFEGWQNFQGETTSRPVCTEKWLERSVILGKLQPSSNYSADPCQLFSGVVGCAADLFPSDVEVLSAGITAFGGQWRSGLTKDVTHLFTLGSDSEKYQNALDYKKEVPITILLPHWFDDVIRLGMGNLDVSPYEWPEPLVLQPNKALANERKKKSNKVELNKEILFSTTSWNAESATTKIMSPKQVFGQRRVLLSSSLGLGARRTAIEKFVERADGIVIPLRNTDGDGDANEEAQKILDCDIFVTRFRSGTAYFKAARAGKTIASMSWVFHVLSIGILTPPLDQLLHYPIPKRPIEGFAAHELTITNFTGDAREYIKKLVCTMGAKFTPSMSSKNTVLIAAQIDGTKTDRARAWGIPIVNHLWLEDCFVNWKNMTVGNDRYIHFPQGSNFAPRLGERGLDPHIEDPDELDRLEEEEADQEAEEELRGDQEPAVVPARGALTQDSARDVGEVADIAMGAYDEPVIHQTDEAHAMHVDVDAEPAHTRTTPQTPVSRPRPKPRATSRKDNNDDFDTTAVPRKSPTKLSFRRSPVIETEAPQIALDVHSASEKENRYGSDGNEEEKELEGTISSKRRKVQGSKKFHGKRRVSHIVDSPESEEELEVHLPKRSPAARAKAKPDRSKLAVKRTRYVSDDEPKELDDEEGDDPQKKKTGRDNEDNDRVGPPSRKRGRPSKQDSAKHDNRNRASDTEESDDDPRPHTPQAKPVSKVQVNVGPSPKQVLVMMPSLGESTRSAGPSSPSKALTKSSNVTVASAERRARPSIRTDTLNSPASGSGRPSRRAAERASQQLHDTVMPDLVKYESEMRKRRRQSSSSVSALPHDYSEDDEHQGGMHRKGKDQAKAKEDNPVINGRKRKISSSRDTVETDRPATSPPKKIKKRKPGSVRVMTTQVSLSDDTRKELEKLGAKFVTKPRECTHLIATKITRTEKFLCAMAVSPWILTDQWIHQSVAAKTLLPEEPFYLKDRGKWNIDLKKSLDEAKKLKYPLLAGRVFYVTPGVKEDRSLLNNVISAFGGKMVACMPNDRQLLSNGRQLPMRHLLTCEDDRKLWEPIAKVAYIHNIELLLQGVLNQFMDFDNPEFHIDGTLDVES